MKKKIISLALTLAVCLGLAIPASATSTVVTTAEELQAAFDKGGDIVLGCDIGAKDTLTVTRSSSLDLNGHQLVVAPEKYKDAAITIELAQTMTILDSQYDTFELGDGKLVVKGRYTAISTTGATLIVNSGVVEARGEYGAGIGGVDQVSRHDGGTVIINGGIVTATGGNPGAFAGAGIGSMGSFGSREGDGGTITINGGTVTATGGVGAAGIGGGSGCVSAGTITINGGYVKAVGAHGIGSGSRGNDGGSLKVTGGTVELVSGGTDATTSFKNCTITGEGAGDYAGSYDSMGVLVAVTEASSWATADVASAVAANLVPEALQSGYTQPTTRAQFCALAVALYEAATGKDLTERKSFNDTNDPNVEKMGALGVVSGTGTNTFNPNGTVTREQAATMLARLAQAIGEPLPENRATFADKSSIASWAVQEVGQVQGVGIMGGVGDNRFDPAGSYTVEQSIITMLRLYKAVTQA